jgi:glutathione synthase/RimK-type ligase-like ATP-grasp enzyme
LVIASHHAFGHLHGMSGDASLLYIIGSGDDADRVTQIGGKLIVTGTSDLTKLLLDRVPHHRLHVGRNYFRQNKQADLTGYRTIVNLITEAEQNTKVLENLKKLLRGVPGRVINKPDAVLRSTRDQVSRMLSGIPGLIVPRAVRLDGRKAGIAAKALEKAGIVPPIILRKTGTHTGKIVGLFDSVDDAVAALEPGEHIATQFVDFSSADGLYRKYRVYFIGNRVILRHMIVSDSWNVHVKDRTRFTSQHPELVAEEKLLFESSDPFESKVRAVFDAIRARVPLDFFGMDFAFTRDGDLVLFEANATMNFFPLWPTQDEQFIYLTKCLEPAQAAFRELLGLPPEVPHLAQVQLAAL